MKPMVKAIGTAHIHHFRTLFRWTSVVLLVLQLGTANAIDYRIDPQETIAGFEVWMLGVVPIRGHFMHTTGAMRFDPASQVGQIEVLIDTTSVETNSARATAATRGPGFFNIERYPRMEFKSSRFVFEAHRLRSIEGLLTLTGITQPVTLAINHATCKAAIARERSVCRADAVVTIKRSTFGMKAWPHSVSDNVTIRISLVAFAESDEATAPPVPVTSPDDPRKRL